MIFRFLTISLLVAFMSLALATPSLAASSLTMQPAHYQLPGIAHNSCYGSNCNNSDAYNTCCAGCSGDSWYVVLSRYIRDNNNNIIGYTRLWWSNTCQTNWTQTVSLIGQTSGIVAEIQLESTRTSYNTVVERGSTNIRTYQYNITSKACAYGLVAGFQNNIGTATACQ